MVCDRDSRSASPISEGSPRTSQVAIIRTDVSVLGYSIFKVHEGISKRSLYYKCNGRGQKMPPYFEKIKKIYILSHYADRM
jgi:hypothetical protein